MFATTCLSHLKFGDYQSSVGPTDTSQVPDITMCDTTGPPRPPAVGELKSFRTVELEDYSIREDYQLSGSVKEHIRSEIYKAILCHFGLENVRYWTCRTDLGVWVWHIAEQAGAKRLVGSDWWEMWDCVD